MFLIVPFDRMKEFCGINLQEEKKLSVVENGRQRMNNGNIVQDTTTGCVSIYLFDTGGPNPVSIEKFIDYVLKIFHLTSTFKNTPCIWPFVVQIFEKTDTTSYLCGGAILSPDYIITAAHCIPEDSAEKRTVYAIG